MASKKKTTEEKPIVEKEYTPSWWLKEISRAKDAHQTYYDRARDAWNALLDNRSKTFDTAYTQRKMNILWSMYQAMLPAYYARTPQIESSLRDKVGTMIDTIASQGWEHAVTYSINEHQNFDGTILDCIMAAMVTGRGVLWETYQTETEAFSERLDVTLGDDGTYSYTDGAAIESDSEVMTDDGEYVMKSGERIASEKSVTDSLHYKDYLHSVDRKPEEVTWKARRVWISKDQAIERYGKEVANDLKYSSLPDDIGSNRDIVRSGDAKVYGKAETWIVYCKASKKVYEVSPEVQRFLKPPEAPAVKLDSFWPCNELVLGTCSPESCIPINDWHLIKDLVESIEQKTDRIFNITDAIRVNYAYDQTIKGALENLLEDDLKGVPIANWPNHSQVGGLKAMMDFLPLDPQVAALQQLLAARDVDIQKLFEVTGYSDLMRGYSQPNVTASAEQQKGNFTILRLSLKQRLVQQCIQAAMRIKAEFIAEKFTDDTLLKLMRAESLVQQLPPPPPGPDGMPMQTSVIEMAMPLLDLLRSDSRRRINLDIDTDSMVFVDQAAEREQRTDFLASFGSYMQQVIPVMEQYPELVPALMQSVQFTARSYRAGKELESSFEQGLGALVQRMQMQKQQGPPPDPKIIESQTRLQIAQAEAAERAEMVKMKQVESQQKLAIEDRKFAIEVEQLKAEQQKTQAELAMKMQEIAIKAEELKVKAAGQEIKAEVDQRVEAVYAIMEQQKIELERTRVQLEQYEKLLEERRLSLDQAMKTQSDRPRESAAPIHINVDASKPQKRTGRISRDELGNATLEIE